MEPRNHFVKYVVSMRVLLCGRSLTLEKGEEQWWKIWELCVEYYLC